MTAADASDVPLADEHAGDISIHESTLLVRGRVWDVRQDRFQFAGTELVRDYVDHTGAVAVLALDDHDRVLLIQQYRHAIAHRDWEIPAGLMDQPGESGLLGAQRELAEEADLAADEWHLLVDTYTTPGGSSEMIRTFLARGLSEIEHDYVREGEEAEIVVRWEPLDTVVEAALVGRIQNGTTVQAVLAADAARSRGWQTLRPATEAWERRAHVRGERSSR
ncbi:MAG: NUDIX domain-containing protein [Leucobacter sp.]